MMIGNKPKEGVKPTEGKIYWWVRCGNIQYARMYDWGWRGFEIAVIRYRKPENGEDGMALPYIFHWGFSFWLPFERL